MMTSRFAKCAVAVGAIGLAGALQSSVQAASTTADAFATVALALTIVKNADMQFGTISESGAGTVVLATDGSRTTTGSASILASGPGAAADFLVTGQPSATYSITLPANGTVSLTGPGAPMAADNFTSLPLATGLLSAGPGTETLLVGAELSIAAGQVDGLYTALGFTVTVNYN